MHGLTDIGLGYPGKVLGRHCADVFGVEVAQLLDIKDGRRFGHAGDAEDVLQLGEAVDFALSPGAPAQQGHIVDHRVRQIALGDQVFIRGVTVALGHLVVLIPHDRAAVHVLRDLPSEALVKQVVLRRGGEILAAAHHVGDAHQMVVDDIGEIIGRQAVALHEDLIVQGAVFHPDIAEDFIMKDRLALVRDLLADDIGLSGRGTAVGLLRVERAAGVVPAGKVAAVLLALRLLAEAAVGVSAPDQELGILSVKPPSLGLDIGADGAAEVRALVMGQAALAQGLIDDVHGAFDQAPLVGVLNAQDKGAVRVTGDQPGIQGGSQVADVHVAGGRGRKTRAHLPMRDSRFHLFKPFAVYCFRHVPFPPVCFSRPLFYLHFTCCQAELNLVEYVDFITRYSYGASIWISKPKTERKSCSRAFSPPAICIWAITSVR